MNIALPQPTTDTPESLAAKTEASLIGALMLHGVERIDLGRLEGRHFSAGLFGRAFDAIKGMAAQGKPITPFALVRTLEGAISATDALNLASSSMPLIFAEGYAEDIYHAGTMRLISEAAAGGRLAEVARLTKDLQTETKAVETIDTRLGRMFEAMRDRADGKGAPSSATTGLIDMDTRIGGLSVGDQVVIAGRPGAGKTTVLTSMALAAARAGHPVLIESLEMTVEQIIQRMAADVLHGNGTPIPYTAFRSGRLTHDTITKLEEAAYEVRQLPIEISDKPATIDRIRANALNYFPRQMARQGKSGVLFVDYMQIVTASDRYRGNRNQEVSEISAGGKSIAKELGICVVQLSQLSRNVESREDKRPMLSDLRDSGSIEQDADVVMFVYRDAYYLEKQIEGETDVSKKLALLTRLDLSKNEIELIVGKNRSGPTGTVRAYCDIKSSVLRNQARPGEEASRWE